MKTIINLVGPPGAGKTKYAGQFIKEYPDWSLCSIDNYRHIYDEEDAWYNMYEDITRADRCIIESSGLSKRLKQDILQSSIVENQNLHTIIFTGNPFDFKRRIKTRSKKDVPFVYKKNLNIFNLVDKALNELFLIYNNAYILCTDNSVNPVTQYKIFKKLLLDLERECRNV